MENGKWKMMLKTIIQYISVIFVTQQQQASTLVLLEFPLLSDPGKWMGMWT